MSDAVKTILAELRRRFEALYGPRLVRMILYGSQARGDAEPGSDIDVLVVLRGPVDPSEELSRTLDDTVDLSYHRGQSIMCVFISEEDYAAGAQPPPAERSPRGGAAMMAEQQDLLLKTKESLLAAGLLRDGGLPGFAACGPTMLCFT